MPESDDRDEELDTPGSNIFATLFSYSPGESLPSKLAMPVALGIVVISVLIVALSSLMGL